MEILTEPNDYMAKQQYNFTVTYLLYVQSPLYIELQILSTFVCCNTAVVNHGANCYIVISHTEYCATTYYILPVYSTFGNKYVYSEVCIPYTIRSTGIAKYQELIRSYFKISGSHTKRKHT